MGNNAATSLALAASGAWWGGFWVTPAGNLGATIIATNTSGFETSSGQGTGPIAAVSGADASFGFLWTATGGSTPSVNLWAWDGGYPGTGGVSVATASSWSDPIAAIAVSDGFLLAIGESGAVAINHRSCP